MKYNLKLNSIENLTGGVKVAHFTLILENGDNKKYFHLNSTGLSLGTKGQYAIRELTLLMNWLNERTSNGSNDLMIRNHAAQLIKADTLIDNAKSCLLDN